MDPQYPIGRFGPEAQVSRAEAMAQIAALPQQVRSLASGMSAKQLDSPYRDGGWTARQVIHHLADSHMHAFIRFRLALTEDRPLIKPFNQQKWAELEDACRGPIEPSLQILDGLHQRWAALLHTMSPADFERKFLHPERGEVALGDMLQLYAWHGRHHLAHLELCAKMGA